MWESAFGQTLRWDFPPRRTQRSDLTPRRTQRWDQLSWLPRASEMHSLKLSIGDVLWRSNLHFQRGRVPGLPHVAGCSVSPVQDQTTWAFGSKTDQLRVFGSKIPSMKLPEYQTHLSRQGYHHNEST